MQLSCKMIALKLQAHYFSILSGLISETRQPDDWHLGLFRHKPCPAVNCNRSRKRFFFLPIALVSLCRLTRTELTGSLRPSEAYAMAAVFIVALTAERDCLAASRGQLIGPSFTILDAISPKTATRCDVYFPIFDALIQYFMKMAVTESWHGIACRQRMLFSRSGLKFVHRSSTLSVR